MYVSSGAFSRYVPRVEQGWLRKIVHVLASRGREQVNVDALAEWLRRAPAKGVVFHRVCSNRTGVDIFFWLVSFSDLLTVIRCVCILKMKACSPTHGSSFKLYGPIRAVCTTRTTKMTKFLYSLSDRMNVDLSSETSDSAFRNTGKVSIS